MDDYVRISKMTILECLDKLEMDTWENFGVEYMRMSNNEELSIQLMRHMEGKLGIIFTSECVLKRVMDIFLGKRKWFEKINKVLCSLQTPLTIIGWIHRW